MRRSSRIVVENFFKNARYMNKNSQKTLNITDLQYTCCRLHIFASC